MTSQIHHQPDEPHATGPDVTAVVTSLRAAREDWRTRLDEARDVASFPSTVGLEHAVALLSAAMYPRRLGGFRGTDGEEDDFVAARLMSALGVLEGEVEQELAYWQHEVTSRFDAGQAGTIVRLFAGTLAEVRRRIDTDVAAAFHGDPAARSVDEVLVCYPGAIASLHHRLAHELHALGAPIVARIISELANRRTGIDIHPGATIGEGFFIDHGTGVVIGETAIVGRRVRLYQHVTLGARSPAGGGERPGPGLARHPIVEDDVVIYAGATILGQVRIGARSTVGGNVWLLCDVPADSEVLQAEARVVDAASGSNRTTAGPVRGPVRGH